MKSCKIYVFLLLLLFSAVKVTATHLRGGEITVKSAATDCRNTTTPSLTYIITITVYVDKESDVLFGGGTLNFGDGTPSIVIPDIPTSNTDLGTNVGTASFSIEHTFPSAGRYLITYTEQNRNAEILNIPKSVDTPFHIETEILIDPTLGCNDSPVLLIPPIDNGCGGVTFYHNPGAFDPDGDSLSYKLVVPKKAIGRIIDGYVFPANPDLYKHTDYNTANEEKDGPPFFSIDPVTGLITWNAPPIVTNEATTNEYNIAFEVQEWRKMFGKWVLLGFVRRDMQIMIESCDNQKPELIVPEDICVEAGTLINEEIFGIDPDKDSVKIEVFSQVLSMDESPATYDPADNPVQFISDDIQGKVTFNWQTECSHVRDQPYQVVFKITDYPLDPLVPKLVNFATWNITVIGPSPNITEVVNEGNNLKVSWDQYICEDDADRMQIWRRVDSNDYIPDSCETGIRPEAGYKLIAEQPASSTNYIDNDLALGAKYCYRIVAQFNDQISTESKVSNELCFEFVPADAPVITNVSVKRTHIDLGEIVVSWKKPFDLDPSFSGDFYYDVYRRTNQSGPASFSLVNTVVNDTTITDTGLNTEEDVFYYRIVLRVPDGPIGNIPVDTSAIASSVMLDPTPEFDRISLQWDADVPWSNVIPNGEGAYHYIFRGADKSQRIDQLELIDSVKVVEAGFSYIDSGQYLTTPLESDKFYCYSVMTRGTYGNPSIESPLDNFSQITCIQPIDTIPPCVPQFNLQGIDCEDYVAQYGCNRNDFQHVLSWMPDRSFTCPADIRTYEVYFAPTTNAEFEQILVTRDTFFVRSDLASYKGCYKIRSQDRAGNYSEFSNVYCFDNCPNYELPNIITPNGDGCNDVFMAFHDINPETDENGNVDWDCGPQDAIGREKCKRFVLSVKFTVFNRWGKQVYSYSSQDYLNKLRQNSDGVGPEDIDYSHNINWTGINNNGEPLPSGVYFYVARVTFDVVNPSESVKDIKGWVHVLR